MRTYNLDDKSFERYRGASKEQVNKLLSNVYADGYKAGMANSKSISELYVTETEFKEILTTTKGIGDGRYADLYKSFIDVNNNRGR